MYIYIDINKINADINIYINSQQYIYINILYVDRWISKTWYMDRQVGRPISLHNSFGIWWCMTMMTAFFDESGI